MTPFQPIALEWGGKPYLIPANKVMGAIATIEEAVTLVELLQMLAAGKPQLAKVSMAWGALLRYAGAAVDDQVVFRGMFAAETNETAMMGLVTALHMMVPTDVMVSPGKDTPAGNVRSAAALTSRKRSRQRSARNG